MIIITTGSRILKNYNHILLAKQKRTAQARNILKLRIKMIRIPDKVTSDDRKSSSSENIRQVALLASGKSQNKPLAANKKPKTEPDNLFSWFQSFF